MQKLDLPNFPNWELTICPLFLPPHIVVQLLLCKLLFLLLPSVTCYCVRTQQVTQTKVLSVFALFSPPTHLLPPLKAGGIQSASMGAACCSAQGILLGPLLFLPSFFFHLFLLVGGWLLYNIVAVFVIHWHESAMDLHVFLPSYASTPCSETQQSRLRCQFGD